MKQKIYLIILLTVSSVLFAQTNYRLYRGMCDASAVTLLDSRYFIVANDEDNLLRIYDQNSSELLSAFDLTTYLGLKYDSKSPETDFEGSTRYQKTIYWITSHGRNKKGHYRPNRYRLFAIQIMPGKNLPAIQITGSSYTNVIQDLLEDEKTSFLNLKKVTKLWDKKVKSLAADKNGLNIEGLTVDKTGKILFIGFRNPLYQGKAILIPLLNVKDVVLNSQTCKFGDPILLDLQGLGIRSIEFSRFHNGYLMIGGPHDHGKLYKLFYWSGEQSVAPIVFYRFSQQNFTPEAIDIDKKTGDILILSDDGALKLDKKCKCKELSDSNEKKFRGIKISLTKDLTH